MNNFFWVKITAMFIACLFYRSSQASCITPINIHANSISTTQIQLDWDDFSTESEGYEVYFTAFDEVPTYEPVLYTTTTQLEINDLIPGVSYNFYVRTICDNNSTNWSNAQRLTTYIDNNRPCDAKIQILDDDCSQNNTFYSQVSGQTGNLGDDIFISQVELSINHQWPSDLSFFLVSPRGLEIELFSKIGIGQQHLGNKDNPCTDPLILNNLSCISIRTPNTPLQGTLQGFERYNELYDMGSANGRWTLKICDLAKDQIGQIEYFKIQFETMSCERPEDLYFQNITDSSVDLVVPSANCDSLKLMIKSPNSLDSLVIDCKGDTFLISNLIADTEYKIYEKLICQEREVLLNCSFFFNTLCNELSVYEDFDLSESYQNYCEAPNFVSEYWMGSNEASPWVVFNGKSPTNFTGPDMDVSKIGNYLLADASSACNRDSAILYSSCFLIENGNECGMTFDYHMWGVDTDSLNLCISIDDGNEWLPIWNMVGDQGKQWNHQTIDLSDYSDQTARFKFTAYTRKGALGDIALDDIKLLGPAYIEEGYVFYKDNDEDNYGGKDSLVICSSTVPEGYTTQGGDCNDDNANIHPMAPELACNILDDNCDGVIDETQGTYEITYSIDSLSAEKCYGSNDGYVRINVENGVEPYTFDWSDGGSGAVRNDLTKGNYTVTISDFGECKKVTEVIEIKRTQSFPGMSFTLIDATCEGKSDGLINITPPPIGAPFLINWSNGATTKKIENLAIGTYVVTLIDVNGCSVNFDFDIKEKNPVIIEEVSIENPTCFEASDAEITINATNGDDPYLYSWENGTSNPSRNNLTSGTYQVTVTDNKGCIARESFTINDPKKLTYTIIELENISCHGEATGKIQIEPKGGTGNYEINWSHNVLEHNFELNNLRAGNYRFTITDDQNCSISSDMISITSPDAIQIDAVAINPEICLGENGGITLEVTGGTGTYNYFWNENQSSNGDITNLSAGKYQIIITDALECKFTTDTIIVPQITYKPDIEVTLIDSIMCHNDEDAAFLIESPNPLYGPLSFNVNGKEYNPTNNEQIVNDLTSGIYKIVASDAYQCVSDTVQLEISNPTPIDIQLDNLTNNKCFGDASGTISLDIEGGNAPYEIAWSNNQFGTSIINLPFGEYQAILKDQNDCIVYTESYSIGQPDSLQSEAMYDEKICFGSETGFIELSTIGGTMPYTYNWSNGKTTKKIENLAAGTYEVTIKDANNCLDSIMRIDINEFLQIEFVDIESTNAVCESNNGTIGFNTEGGNGAYAYFMNNESILDSNIDGLTPGQYSIYAIDENQCKSPTLTVTIFQKTIEPQLSVDRVTDIKCHNDANGEITLNVNNDELKAPFKWQLNDEDIISTNNPNVTFEDLGSDDYTIYFEDSQICKDSIKQIIIENPEEIILIIDSIAYPLCFGDKDGYISTDPTGGVAPYEIEWSNGSNETTLVNPDFDDLFYILTDEAGCVVQSESYDMAIPDQLELTATIENETESQADGSIIVDVFGGTPDYSFSWSSPIQSTTNEALNLTSGKYDLTILDINGCIIDTTFMIDRISSTLDLDNEVNIYPIPAQTFLNFKSPNSIFDIQLFNVVGQKIPITKGIRDGESIIHWDKDIPNGWYFVKVLWENKSHTTHPIYINTGG